MGDELFLSTNELGTLVDHVGAYVGAGLAFALIVWMLGMGIYFLFDVMKGG